MSRLAMEKLRSGVVIPAIPLALDSRRKLDERRQRALVRYYLSAGAGGIAAAVHTTQFAIRDPKFGLFEPVLKIVADEINEFEKDTKKTIVKVAGVCGPAPQAVREAETARSLGYDAALLSPGGLSNLTEEQMVSRTKDVAAVLPVIGFYLQTAVGGRKFSFDYWQKICDIKNVAAIKMAPFNRYETLDVARAAAMSARADEITLYTGNDDNIVVDLLTKYRFTENGKTYEKKIMGGLLGHYAVWTYTSAAIFDRVKKVSGEHSIPASLLTLANEITDANAAFFDAAHNFAGCIAGIHEVLRRQGLLEGIWLLDENETLSPGQSDEIDRVYRMYPHLSDDAFVSENIKYWLE